jgi:hypothetical protein
MYNSVRFYLDYWLGTPLYQDIKKALPVSPSEFNWKLKEKQEKIISVIKDESVQTDMS